MGIFEFSISQIELFLLVVFRILALLMVLPIFDNQKILPRYKILMSLVIAFVMYPLVKDQGFLMPSTVGNIAWVIIRELFIGLVIGFTAKLVFSGIELAAQFSGIQMGFGASNIVDPITSQRMLVVSTFQLWFATILFLSLDGHHLFFSAIADTFHRIPIGTAVFSGDLAKSIVDSTSMVFLIAIKIAAPITAVMIMTNAILGIISRFIPQINVFIMSFPLSIGIGLIILSSSIPFIAYMIKSLYETMSFDIAKVISLM